MSSNNANVKSIADYQEELNEFEQRYVVEKVIGSGSYGLVLKAIDKVDNSLVAIKRVNKEIFEEMILAKRILREIKLLGHFHDDNIIGLRNIITPKSEDFESFYIVMDLMETDLKHVIRSGQTLSDAHLQFFIYQTLRALHVIHSAGVIHRDVTPSNLLVNTNCDLKICDFGLAKEESDEGEEMTDYVTMRWYRAPELVMEHKSYTAQIDVWGVGCILGELLGSRPLCQGRDRVNQLDKIIDLIGTPDPDELNSIGSQAAQKYIRKKGARAPIDFKEKYPNANPDAIDLLAKMLKFHPDNRITVREAMRHPYFSQLYDESDERCDVPLFTFDESPLKSIVDVKTAIYQTALEYKMNNANSVPRAPSIAQNIAVEAAGPSENSITNSKTKAERGNGAIEEVKK